VIRRLESQTLRDSPPSGMEGEHRINSVKDGKVLYRIADPLELKETSAAEGLAVDPKGNVYGAEVGPRQLVKHDRQSQRGI